MPTQSDSPALANAHLHAAHGPEDRAERMRARRQHRAGLKRVRESPPDGCDGKEQSERRDTKPRDQQDLPRANASMCANDFALRSELPLAGPGRPAEPASAPPESQRQTPATLPKRRHSPGIPGDARGASSCWPAAASPSRIRDINSVYRVCVSHCSPQRQCACDERRMSLRPSGDLQTGSMQSRLHCGYRNPHHFCNFLI